MAKLWLTEDLLGQEYSEIIICHNRMNHCSFRYLLRSSKRGIIPKKIRKVRTAPPPCVVYLFGKSYKRPWRTKGKCSGKSIRKTLETRPGDMTLIDQTVYAQTGLITQVTGDLNHTIFW